MGKSDIRESTKLDGTVAKLMSLVAAHINGQSLDLVVRCDEVRRHESETGAVLEGRVWNARTDFGRTFKVICFTGEWLGDHEVCPPRSPSKK